MSYNIVKMTNVPLNPKAGEPFTVTIEIDHPVTEEKELRIPFEKKRIIDDLTQCRPVSDTYLKDLTVLSVTIKNGECSATSEPIVVLKDAKDFDSGSPVVFPDLLLLPARIDAGPWYGHMINVLPTGELPLPE